EMGRRQLDLTRWRTQHLRDTWLKRTQIDAVGMSLQRCQVQPMAVLKAVAIGTAAQKEVQQAFWSPAQSKRLQQFLRVSPLHARARRSNFTSDEGCGAYIIQHTRIRGGTLDRENAGQAQENFPLVRSVRLAFQCG